MKKIIIMAAMMLSLGVDAQNVLESNKWIKQNIPADELTGQKLDYNYHIIKDGGCVIYRLNKGELYLMSDDVFNIKDGNIDVLIGLYDVDGNLVKKFENVKFTKCRGNNYRSIRLVGRTDINGVITNHLYEGKGYVRFVTWLFGGKKFDVTVPCGLVML